MCNAHKKTYLLTPMAINQSKTVRIRSKVTKRQKVLRESDIFFSTAKVANADSSLLLQNNVCHYMILKKKV